LKQKKEYSGRDCTSNLEKIAPYVRAFCEEEGVSYASATPWQSTREIFHYLRGVANTVSANHRLAKSLA
jgi:hypothetical protein